MNLSAPMAPFDSSSTRSSFLREILPQHDAFCLEEVRLVLAHLAGESSAAQMLKIYLDGPQND